MSMVLISDFHLSVKLVHKLMSKLQLCFSWQGSATKYKLFNGSARCFNQYFINYYYQREQCLWSFISKVLNYMPKLKALCLI